MGSGHVQGTFYQGAASLRLAYEEKNDWASTGGPHSYVRTDKQVYPTSATVDYTSRYLANT